MLGNAWEWVDGGEPARRTLRGGSFVDHDPQIAPKVGGAKSSRERDSVPNRGANHAITPGTRMETTQDSGSINTSFRCCSSSGNRVGEKKPRRNGGQQRNAEIEL